MSTVTANRPRSKASKTNVVTLALAIDHQVYSTTPIRGIADPDVLKAFRLEKRSDRDAVYDVALTVRGLECSCPDFEARHRGLPTAGCKHVRGCVEMGLLDRPAAPAAPAVPTARVADEADIPAPEPEPAVEPAPIVVDDATARSIEASGILESEGWAPSLARFLGGNPEVAAVVAPEAVEPTPEPEPPADDVESDPAEWPPWTDSDRWEDDGGPVHVAIDPPAPTGGMSLLEWVRHVAAGFRGLDTAAADLVAEAVEALARGIACTDAKDPATYRDRIDFA